MYIEIGEGNAINAKIPVILLCFPVAIQMIHRQEGLLFFSFFFFLMYHDTGDTERISEHGMQPHAKIHITLNMDVEIKGKRKKVCGGVSQFSSKQRIQRDLKNNVLCVFG